MTKLNKGWRIHKISNLNIFIKSGFNQAFDSFWSSVMTDMPNSQVIGVLVKIKEVNGGYKTLGPLCKITKSNRANFRATLKHYTNSKGKTYQSLEISSIFFQYILLGDNATTHIPSITPKKVISYSFGDYNYPLSTDLSQWGKIIKRDGNKVTLVNENYKDVLIVVTTLSDKQIYEICIDDKAIRVVVDNLSDFDHTFTRTIDNQTFIIKNGKIIFKKVKKQSDYITKISKDNFLIEKFLTFDIETKIINSIHTPYCISFYDGKIAWSFFLSDFKSIDDMMNTALRSIMKAKYNGMNVYAHNGSKFDHTFIMKYLTLLGKVNPLMKDDKFINVKVSWGEYKNKKGKVKYKYNINLRDSVLMLPSSLRKLAKAFNVVSKGFFPYDFINNFTVPLNYIGYTPKFSYYEEITKDIYNSLFSKTWNLRQEAIHYCELDCKVLHQILFKFNELIFKKWSLNIHNFPTLSSLAIGIFRSSYLGDHKIPKLGGYIFDFIKQGYTGGRVDVIRPSGDNLFYYDVNSLYPTVYSANPMPVGDPTWFEGNILEHQPDAFGFFKCKIESPKYMHIPILQTHMETKKGLRTVAPLGSWVGVLFSEEMKVAISYGYKITVLEGYTFDKAIIFDKYAADLFQIKQSHDSTHPMYLISKLLLNSLYGKFGMSIDLESCEIIDSESLNDFLNVYNPTNVIDLENGKTLVMIPSERDELNDETKMNVSVGIAAAITAYARMHMTPLLQDPSYNVYYTDTDSIVTDKPINENYIGKALGQLKLEYKIVKGVFLAPKVYSLISDLGKIVTKVKGLKDPNIPFELFEDLLYKGRSATFNHEKMNRSLIKGHIKVTKQAYKLKATENKRELVYNISQKAIDSRPLEIKT